MEYADFKELLAVVGIGYMLYGYMLYKLWERTKRLERDVAKMLKEEGKFVLLYAFCV